MNALWRGMRAIAIWCLVGAMLIIAPVAAAEAPLVFDASDVDGVRVHRVRSDLQAGETEIRVLQPVDLQPARRYPTVYVLPVEAGAEHRYGDGIAEIKER